MIKRTVLMTGASRGIGRAIAERLLRDGHRLSLGVRSPERLRGSSLDPLQWPDLSLIHISEPTRPY